MVCDGGGVGDDRMTPTGAGEDGARATQRSACSLIYARRPSAHAHTHARTVAGARSHSRDGEWCQI